MPEHEPIPVLNCLVQPDSLLTVYLSQSIPTLSDSQTIIQNATVELLAEGEHSEFLSEISPGVYQSSQAAEIGIHYSLEANIEGFPLLKASTTIPEPPEITGGVYDYEGTYIPELSSYRNEVTVSFRDPQRIENFYQITFYSYWYRDIYGRDSITGEYGVIDSSLSVNLTFDLDSFHPAVRNENESGSTGYQFGLESLIFSDELLTAENSIPFIFLARQNVLMRSISKDYYLYEKSRIRQYANMNTLSYSFSKPFLSFNPVNLYSNVENGLGIFAGFSETHYELEVINEPEW